MTTRDQRHGVWLGNDRIGALNQRGDYTWFTFADEYLANPDRPVLGLVFEQGLQARHASALRLPPWFSNLLPEGRLRDWIAADRKVSADREMELLAQVGHDLPGAVRVLPDAPAPDDGWDPASAVVDPYGNDDSDSGRAGWRFSLAGVGLKFSMLKRDDRLTLPAHGAGGDWIVKLPDRVYADVPRNEHAMMSLAAAVGIDVPEVALAHRSKLDNLPRQVWPDNEEYAYAVRRFDRDDNRVPVHIEDLAQVRNVYSDRKYAGNFETVAALSYRGRDTSALREFARRLAFNILISNGDAHLKNWSLLYPDRRIPTLSPAYDLVCTAAYRDEDDPEDLGLKFGGTRQFRRISYKTFTRLGERLNADHAELAAVVAETVERTEAAWPTIAPLLDHNKAIQDVVAHSIETHASTLLMKST
ncbi:phosphatidylinositol kinase [Actinosynnema sp. ALI-1.44]|uniref:type II toxin-antitoxin system HipA family toxin n=1 Tax=Actinosynnema sp. ALI-1.44 TaxID=1933779 RepID=UPI00097C6304|nr:HipA domain-containing protein [Actinosynnema sp. ALI-1.44]ONI86369.1 phosphatidylinositol kinase [Actinosynnema sp. ALI-1.44]